MVLHKGKSKAEAIIEKFLTDTTNFINESTKILATTSDSTGNMNKFGIGLEQLGIFHPYALY